MKITLINSNNEELVIPTAEKYILQHWSGFGDSVHSLATEKAPDQIGSTVINRIFEPRSLNIQFAIKANIRQEVFDLRREVIGILNYMYKEGKLKWEQNDGTVYQIDAFLDSLQMPGGDAQGNAFQIVQLSLLAEDPRWYDEEITDVNLLADSVTYIYNEGDIKTDCVITIEGPIANPEISNLNSGKTIKINYDLQPDEKIIIDTEFGNKSVVFENSIGKKSRAMSLLDLDSELFYLESGKNTIETNAVTKIEFYQKYLGV